MVIDEICKITVKGVKLKSESFFSKSHGVLSYGGNPKGADSAPGPDRVDKHNILYKYRYGFLANFSTTHELLHILNYIYTALDERKYVFGIYIDLKKPLKQLITIFY